MTETLATLMSVVCLLCLTRWSNALSWRSAALSGLVLGTATLCRPTFLVWTALVVIFIAIYYERWQGVNRAAVMVAGFLVVLLPWVIRNQQVMGRAVLATTHGGYTLLLGNNPYFYRHLRTAAGEESGTRGSCSPMLARTASAARRGTRGTRALRSLRATAACTNWLGRRFARSRPCSLMPVWCGSCGSGRPLPHQLSPDETARRAAARWGVALWYAIVFSGALAGLGGLRSHRTVSALGVGAPVSCSL